MAQMLARNVPLGVNPRVTARQMRDEFGAAETRALTIARTESLRAFRAASLMTFAENSDSLDGWIWLSANNKRTCVSCLAMHGSVHPLTEEMQEHVNGRCVAAPRVKGANLRVETGAERFERWAEREQRAALGPAMYEAWRDGAVRLTPGGAGSVVGRRVSQQWGDSVYARSLRAIVGPERAAEYTRYARITGRIMTLAGREGIVRLGDVPAALHQVVGRVWPNSVTLSVVLTGERRQHYVARHPDVQPYERELSRVIAEPAEVHRNRSDAQVALLYRRSSAGQWLRATVWISNDDGRQNSVLSFRLARDREVERARREGRRLWP